MLYKLLTSDLTVQLEAIDPDYPNDTSIVQFSLESPTAGVEVSSSGLLSWALDSNTNLSINVILTDSCGSSIVQQLALVVVECPCQNFGTCSPLVGSQVGSNEFQCECVQGTSGQLCEIDINDSCTPNPCIPGTCVDQLTGYTCDCGNDQFAVDCGTPASQDPSTTSYHSTSRETPDTTTTSAQPVQETTQKVPGVTTTPAQTAQETTQKVPDATTTPVQTTQETTQKVPDATTNPAQTTQKTTQKVSDATTTPDQTTQETTQKVPDATTTPAQTTQETTQKVPDATTTPAQTTQETTQKVPDATTTPVQTTQETTQKVPDMTTTDTQTTQVSKREVSATRTTSVGPVTQENKQKISDITTASAIETTPDTNSTSVPTRKAPDTTTVQPTTVMPILGWSSWSQWSECSRTCDYGLRKRQRKCNSEQHDACEGVGMQTEQCILESCKGNVISNVIITISHNTS